MNPLCVVLNSYKGLLVYTNNIYLQKLFFNILEFLVDQSTIWRNTPFQILSFLLSLANNTYEMKNIHSTTLDKNYGRDFKNIFTNNYILLELSFENLTYKRKKILSSNSSPDKMSITLTSKIKYFLICIILIFLDKIE